MLEYQVISFISKKKYDCFGFSHSLQFAEMQTSKINEVVNQILEAFTPQITIAGLDIKVYNFANFSANTSNESALDS